MTQTSPQCRLRAACLCFTCTRRMYFQFISPPASSCVGVNCASSNVKREMRCMCLYFTRCVQRRLESPLTVCIHLPQTAGSRKANLSSHRSLAKATIKLPACFYNGFRIIQSTASRFVFTAVAYNSFALRFSFYFLANLLGCGQTGGGITRTAPAANANISAPRRNLRRAGTAAYHPLLTCS